jgi:hypothetical protein
VIRIVTGTPLCNPTPDTDTVCPIVVSNLISDKSIF